MQKFLRKIIIACSIVVFVGAGCSSGKNNEQQTTQIDANLKLYAMLPQGWSSTKFDALYKSPGTPSGLAKINGGSNSGFGPTNDKGELLVKVHVIAVPKAQASDFEKNLYPENVVRRFDDGGFVIYTSQIAASDADVGGFVESLKVGE